jgi:hypothetical protein
MHDSLVRKAQVVQQARYLCIVFQRAVNEGGKSTKVQTNASIKMQLNFAGIQRRLIAVLVHLGNRINSGHYVAYTFSDALVLAICKLKV